MYEQPFPSFEKIVPGRLIQLFVLLILVRLIIWTMVLSYAYTKCATSLENMSLVFSTRSELYNNRGWLEA